MALFDKDAFTSLIDGDKNLYAELLQLYATDYPKIIAELRTAIGGGDVQLVEILAHRLRGMVRNFFAADVADIAETIEEGGRNGSLTGALEKLEELAKMLRSLEEELASHLGTLK